MARPLVIPLLVLALGFSGRGSVGDEPASAWLSGSVAPGSSDGRPPAVIVKLKPGADPEACHRRIAEQLGFSRRPGRERRLLRPRASSRRRASPAAHARGLERLQLTPVPGGRSVAELVAAYAADVDVEYAEPDAAVSVVDTLPGDPRWGRQWGPRKIGAPRAWDVAQGTPALVVAVLDTGIDTGHPDLEGNLWWNPGEIPGNRTDDDGNGFVDDLHGYDFVNEDGDVLDDHGHGTHVSGILGAVGNNGEGVAGLSWRVAIMPLKILDSNGSGRISDVVRAVDYAMANGARIMNASFGSNAYSRAVEDALAAAQIAGQLFIAAAGNESRNNDTVPHYPSSYDLDNVIAVAASDQNDGLASFSNYGDVSVDLSAPGVDVESTLPTYPNERGRQDYGKASGTSMATPHVAGVAALLWGWAPELRYDELRARLLAGVDAVPGLPVATRGRLVAPAAFAGLGIGGEGLAPTAPVDLRITAIDHRSVTLEWTATGDEGPTGLAALYDVRYAPEPLDDVSWATAMHATSEPIPGPAGMAERFTVDGLFQGRSYYLALRVMDPSGNYSALSNSVVASTDSLVPVSITVAEGDGQVAPGSAELADPLAVLVADTAGLGVSGVAVAFDVTDGGHGAFVDPPVAWTDVEGIARARLTLGEVPPATLGVTHRVQASAAGVGQVELRAGAHARIDMAGVLEWRPGNPGEDPGFFRDFDVGDADGDGRGDLAAIVSENGTVTLRVLEAKADDQLVEVWRDDPGVDIEPSVVRIADVDDDGQAEILLNPRVPNVLSDTYAPLIYESVGDDAYAPVAHDLELPVRIATSSIPDPRSIEVADVDRDGRVEIAFWHQSGVHLWEHRGAPGIHEYEEVASFAPIRTHFALGQSWLAIADTDGDGRLELLPGAMESGDPTFEYGETWRTEYDELSGTLEVKGPIGYLQAFAPENPYRVATVTQPVVLDLDGDGVQELVAAGRYGCTCAVVFLGESASDNSPGPDEPCLAGNLAVFGATGDDTYAPLWSNVGSLTCDWLTGISVRRAASVELNALPPGIAAVLAGSYSDYHLASVFAVNPFPFAPDYLTPFWRAPRNLGDPQSPGHVAEKVAQADLDADGRPELLVLVHSYQNRGETLYIFEEQLDVSQPQAPVLEPLGSMAASLWSPLVLTVTASDLNRDPLTYAASGLPPGASFDALRRRFSWTPALGQEGDHLVTFSVTDGQFTDSQDMVLRVRRDLDRDGRSDEEDNCPIHRNPDQGDYDGDGIGDACDPDGGPPPPQALLDRDPGRCIDGMNRRGAGIAKAQNRENENCLRSASLGQTANLGQPGQVWTAQACLTNDVRGRMARTSAKLVDHESRRCLAEIGQLPSYAYLGAAAVETAARNQSIGIVISLLGPELDVAIVEADLDRDGADCQKELIKRADRYFEALWNAALKGKKQALRCSRAVTPRSCQSLGVPIVRSSQELEVAVMGYVGADVNGRVQRVASRLRDDQTLARCAGAATPLAQLFPSECAGSVSATELASCAERMVRCRFCESLNGFDGLGIDCDDYDDHASNESCGLVLSCSERCEAAHDVEAAICQSGVDAQVCAGNAECVSTVAAERAACFASADAALLGCLAPCD